MVALYGLRSPLEDMLRSKLVTGWEKESLLSSAWGNTAGYTHLLGQHETRRTILPILLLHDTISTASPLVWGTPLPLSLMTCRNAGEGSACRRAAKQSNISLPKQS